MTPNQNSCALRKCRSCGSVYAEDSAHPCDGGSDPYTEGMTIDVALRVFGMNTKSLSERLAEVERERDEARTQIGAIEYADEEIRRQYGAEFGLLDPDDSPPCWADFAEHIRVVTKERDEAIARVEAEHKGCNAWSAKLTKERDEARAYMPVWSRDGAALYLSIGDMRVAMIEPYSGLFLPIVRPDELFVDTGPRWLTKADDIEAAARSICARLRIPYVPVPEGM